MVLTEQKSLIEEMMKLNLEVVIPGEVGHCMGMHFQSSLVERIKKAQAGDKQLQNFKKQVEAKLRTDLVIHEDESLRYGARLCAQRRYHARIARGSSQLSILHSSRRSKDAPGS